MRHRLPLLIRFVLAAAPAGLMGCAASTPPPDPPRASSPSPPSENGAGALLPSTPLVTIDGVPADLHEMLRGRAAVISLWATWCDACTAEMSALKRLDAQAGTRGDAVVLGIAVGEPHATVAAFAHERGLDYARLVDEDFRLADALGQRRVPATLVVDRSGHVVYRGGALDAAGLAAFRAALGDSAGR
jgi:peroxiredoxin